MYGLNLDENKRILSACIVNEFTPEGIVKVDRLPEKEITDYLYIDNQYVYEPLPKILSKEQEKQRQHQTMKAMMEQEAQTAFLLDLRRRSCDYSIVLWIMVKLYW